MVEKKLFISFDRVFVSNQNFIILQVKNCLNFKFFLKWLKLKILGGF